MDQLSHDLKYTAPDKHAPDAGKLSAVRRWLLAVRPRTLSLSVTPVAAATALAYLADGTVNVLAFVLAVTAAIAIQIGTNLWNDACDGERGVDSASRIGTVRVTAAGLITAPQVRRGAITAFLLAGLCGVGLVAIGGLPILAIGVVSLICGFLYSSGPHPIAATPFGEVFVLAFFGVIAVTGTYFLHTETVTVDALLLGMVVGLPAAAVLLVNNHRDRYGDFKSGRRTLAIVAGISGSRFLYTLLFVLTALATTVLIGFDCLPGLAVVMPGFATAGWHCHRFFRQPIDAGLNKILARTAALQLVLASSTILALFLCNLF